MISVDKKKLIGELKKIESIEIYIIYFLTVICFISYGYVLIGYLIDNDFCMNYISDDNFKHFAKSIINPKQNNPTISIIYSKGWFLVIISFLCLLFEVGLLFLFYPPKYLKPTYKYYIVFLILFIFFLILFTSLIIPSLYWMYIIKFEIQKRAGDHTGYAKKFINLTNWTLFSVISTIILIFALIGWINQIKYKNIK